MQTEKPFFRRVSTQTSLSADTRGLHLAIKGEQPVIDETLQELTDAETLNATGVAELELATRAIAFFLMHLDHLKLVGLSPKKVTNGCEEAVPWRTYVKVDDIDALTHALQLRWQNALDNAKKSTPLVSTPKDSLSDLLQPGDLDHELKALYLSNEVMLQKGISNPGAKDIVFFLPASKQLQLPAQLTMHDLKESRLLGSQSNANPRGRVAPWNPEYWNAHHVYDTSLRSLGVITTNLAHRNWSAMVPFEGLLEALKAQGVSFEERSIIKVP